MLNTVGRFIYPKTEEYCMLDIVGRFIYTKYWGILLSWLLWEDLFTQNTRDYVMLSTVGKFIYTKYWEILYAEHSGNIDLHTILGITLCWAL
jgi:hypothetical protein